MSSVLDYSEGHTSLHRANPVAKLALAICVCLAAFLSQSPLMLLGIIAFLVATGVYAGMLRRTLALLAGFSLLALLMFVVQTALVRQGTPLLLWVTDVGLQTGLRVALRLVAFAMPLVMMLSLTRLTDLANASVELLHVPYRYAFTITTALRFVPIFSDQMSKIVEAQTARGVEFDTPNPLRKLHLMLPLAAPLLISSVARADATALAAEERGFYLRRRSSSYKRYPLVATDALCVLPGLVLVVLGILF
ncbi:energy-coupling factor transporter transmembrane component T family protein [Olsenella urininfantis]|uniref:energy-coupling factor transporter transmembrane component T family protein n=1 Tax=Olsenella urininfantis TaxID=1871033 RepID=UPI000985CBD7|nr:energy-coupling factor transporter transmembrane component T [Olsenella urininfantis]